MRKILKWVGIVGGLLVGLSILLVVALRWMPVYITPLMVGRTVDFEAHKSAPNYRDVILEVER